MSFLVCRRVFQCCLRMDPIAVVHSGSELPAGNQPPVSAMGSDSVPAPVSFSSSHYTTLASESASPALLTTDAVTKRISTSTPTDAPATQGATEPVHSNSIGAATLLPAESGTTTTSYLAPASTQDVQELLQLLHHQHGYRPHDEAAAHALYESGMSKAAMLESLISYKTDTALLVDFLKQGLLVRTSKGAHVAPNQPRIDETSEGYQPFRFAAAMTSPVVAVQKKEFEARQTLRAAAAAGLELGSRGDAQLQAQRSPVLGEGEVFVSAQQLVQQAQEEEDARSAFEQAGGAGAADVEEVIAAVVKSLRASARYGPSPLSQSGEG